VTLELRRQGRARCRRRAQTSREFASKEQPTQTKNGIMSALRRNPGTRQGGLITLGPGWRPEQGAAAIKASGKGRARSSFADFEIPPRPVLKPRSRNKEILFRRFDPADRPPGTYMSS